MSAPAIVATAPLPRISLRRALYFPFTQRNWPHALAYIAAIQFIPILGYLIIRGWRFEIAQRVGSNAEEALPDWRHAWTHLKQGLLLFSVTVVHYIPMYVLLSWPRWGILRAIWRLLEWLYYYLFTEVQVGSLSDVLYDGLHSLVIFIAILIIVPPIISAIVESATQRYAHTGRVVTLFQFWRSIALVFDDLYDVARIEGGILLLNLLAFIVSTLLLLTVGGATLIPPIMIPIYMWTRGALMGQWIWKNRQEELARVQR